MAKLLKDIIGGKNSSTKKVNDLGGYKPKAGDEEKFVKKHEIEKWEDRNGNGDDVFNATKIKHSQINDTRHGYKNPEDIKVHESSHCNMTKENISCPIHGLKECMSESKLKEDWIVTHSDGKVTKHIGQMDAMRASKKSPGSKVSATHGAMGQKASTVLAPHQSGNIGTFSAAGYTPPEKKKKMREELDLEENKLYHVSWGGSREHQVVAKHGEEAVSKAKDAIIKKIPKLQDKKYADAFDRKPTVTNLSHERKVQKDKVQEEVEELDEISVVGKSKVSNFVFSKKGKENRAAYIAKQKAQYDPVMKKQKEIKSKNLEMLKAVSAKRKTANEEVEELDELSKNTLGSYAAKAHKQGDMAARMSNGGQKKNMTAIANKRYQGVQTAIKKMREETLDEKAVSQAQQKAAGAALATQRGEYDGGKKGGAVNRMALMKRSELEKIASTKRTGLPMRKEEVDLDEDDKHFEKQTPKMQSAINLHLRKGKSYPEAVKAAKVYVKESLAVPLLGGDEDESAEMLKTQLKAIANKAMHLVTQLSDDQLIEPWVQSKIAVAKEQVSAVHDYMIYGNHDKNNVDKEQTGPDMPLTFPGMNVDVNSGVNV